jgi:hypothetical protein
MILKNSVNSCLLIISTCKNTHELRKFREKLNAKFKCSEGKELSWCLGMEINQTECGKQITSIRN